MIQAIINLFPGRFGFFFRRLFYSRKLFKSGSKISFGKFLEIINPGNIEFGNKCSIGGFSFFSADGGKIIIGDEVSFNRNVHINASIGGNIKIENFCLIGPNVVMRTANHNYQSREIPIRNQGHTFHDIYLEEDVWLGANVIILPNVRIGKGSIIAAGSVVTKSIPSYSIAAGVPAKVIKNR